MLGSPVALGDDLVAMVVFSAMLGSTLDTCSWYVAMLCGGESFSPDDAYDSAWTALCL